MKTTKQWIRLLREVVQSSSLDVFKTDWIKPWLTWPDLAADCTFEQEVGLETLWCTFQPEFSFDHLPAGSKRLCNSTNPAGKVESQRNGNSRIGLEHRLILELEYCVHLGCGSAVGSVYCPPVFYLGEGIWLECEVLLAQAALLTHSTSQWDSAKCIQLCWTTSYAGKETWSCQSSFGVCGLFYELKFCSKVSWNCEILVKSESAQMAFNCPLFLVFLPCLFCICPHHKTPPPPADRFGQSGAMEGLGAMGGNPPAFNRGNPGADFGSNKRRRY